MPVKALYYSFNPFRVYEMTLFYQDTPVRNPYRKYYGTTALLPVNTGHTASTTELRRGACAHTLTGVEEWPRFDTGIYGSNNFRPNCIDWAADVHICGEDETIRHRIKFEKQPRWYNTAADVYEGCRIAKIHMKDNKVVRDECHAPIQWCVVTILHADLHADVHAASVSEAPQERRKENLLYRVRNLFYSWRTALSCLPIFSR